MFLEILQTDASPPTPTASSHHNAVIASIMTDPVYVALVAAVVIPVGLFILSRSRQRRRDANSRLPPFLPLGYISTTLQMSDGDAPWFVLKWARQIGFVYRIRLPMTKHIIVVGDAVLAREILNDRTTTKPDSFYGAFDILVGAANIFTANGERWKHARKAAAPAFAFAHIKRMNRVCEEKLEDWIQRRLNVFCKNGEAFDPAREMLLLTMCIICKSAFEYDVEPEEAEFFIQEEVIAMKEYLLKQEANPIRATWLGYLFAYTDIRRANQAIKNMQVVAYKMLDSYRSNKKAEDATGTVIERIVTNPAYENDKERVADMIVFLVAGHDTTGYSIAWTLLELARHPSEVVQARRELKSLESAQERLKSSLLGNLVKEAMRLHPVAPFGGVRDVHRDFRVDDNTIIPKGSIVLTPVILFHRNPQYFDRPDEFLPDRWNEGNDNEGFMPFVAGHRNCIGQALATVELHTVIARLLMDYDFDVVDPGKPDFVLTLRPSGVRLKAKRL